MYTAMSLADVHKFSVYQLTGKIIIRFVLKTVQFNPKRKIGAFILGFLLYFTLDNGYEDDV
jgi:hypothetical protein